MLQKNSYPLLNKDHFIYIQEVTGYSESYIRQVLKGYVKHSKRHDSIFKQADIIHQRLIKSFKK